MKQENLDLPQALKENRIQNSVRNAFFSIINTVIISLAPFLIRTCMIYYMGDKYAGLNSVLVSLVSLLNMTDLGITGVIVYFLYEPLAKGDLCRVGAFLYALKRVYMYIGGIFFLLGLLIIPFLHIIIAEDIPPNANLYSSYLILLSATSLPFFFFPEVDALVTASQRSDLASIISVISLSATYIIEIIAIVCFQSFLLYYVAFFAQASLSLALRLWIKKHFFAGIRTGGELDLEEKAKIKNRVIALFGHQMNDRFINSVDSVVLSSFMGLSIVAIYGNYMYVVSAVMMLMSSVISAITAAIGNALITETVESNYIRFKAVLWLNGILTIWAFVCMLCSYQPFMRIWMNDRLFHFDIVILFCLYFFVLQIRQTVLVFKNAKGMWLRDRFKPYISLIINLLLDIVLVRYIGVSGVLVSSILCIALILIPWEANVLCRGYFGIKINDYIQRVLSYFVIAVVLSAICYFLCNKLCICGGIIEIVWRILLCSLVSVGFFIVLYRGSADMIVWRDSLCLLKEKMGKSK